MYILTHNDRVFLGPMPWKQRMFQSVIEDDYDLKVDLPRTDPKGRYDVDSKIVIRPAEKSTEPSYNPRIQDLQGPSYDIQQDKIIMGYSVRTLPLDLVRGQLKERAAVNRWVREVQGVTINIQGQDIIIPTGRDTRDMFVQAYQFGGLFMPWKLSQTEWITFQRSDLGYIIDAVAAHVQAQFTWEFEKAAEIDACETSAELAVVDVGDPVIDEPAV